MLRALHAAMAEAVRKRCQGKPGRRKLSASIPRLRCEPSGCAALYSCHNIRVMPRGLSSACNRAKSKKGTEDVKEKRGQVHLFDPRTRKPR
jgi:hypothetical protein